MYICTTSFTNEEHLISTTEPVLNGKKEGSTAVDGILTQMQEEKQKVRETEKGKTCTHIHIYKYTLTRTSKTCVG